MSYHQLMNLIPHKLPEIAAYREIPCPDCGLPSHRQKIFQDFDKKFYIQHLHDSETARADGFLSGDYCIRELRRCETTHGPRQCKMEDCHSGPHDFL